MRCIACNDELTDHEATWKDLDTGEFFDLCGTCYSHMRAYSNALEIEADLCYNEKLKDNENNQ